jgi:hypothetical protein
MDIAKGACYLLCNVHRSIDGRQQLGGSARHTPYAFLLRLKQRGWIVAKWGVSESNRTVRYYSITKSGLRQLKVETETWERISGVTARALSLQGEKQP